MYGLTPIARQRPLQRIAVLTSGGDAPGMNAAIRAVVRTGCAEGVEVLGIRRGYSGLLAADMTPLDSAAVANILQRGGTVLKSDRCEAFHDPANRRKAADELRQQGVEALVVIGGEGSLTGALHLEQETGFPVLGLPGTIDNDIYGSDDSIGFDSAVNTALSAIDRIRDTASSHDRLFLVEVMGRNTGFIAAYAGIAGGAELILAPQREPDPEALYRQLLKSQQAGKTSSLVLVAEGSKPGRTQWLAQELEQKGLEPRVCILGHTQRGGAPTGHDRMLASYLGSMAVRHLLAGDSQVMLGVRNNTRVAVPLTRVVNRRKHLDPGVLELAAILHE
ncbi:6-phosphofructokinase [Motiliproteus sp. SC1-56]|uniref:6-phosphofructokinase n=1 Tax=Motiliproteus sp. SC1-56 TaxID=2799565 RepID=UPI001A90AF84|nr:6-phosphofructokinase [Motiliproteus sp. SC1-56]